MLHTLWPREPGHTEVVCEFFFEPTTIVRPDFDPADAVRFWDQTNRQDWRVCELTQRGVSSPGYTAGRYSGQEADVHAFDTMIAAATPRACARRWSHEPGRGEARASSACRYPSLSSPHAAGT